MPPRRALVRRVAVIALVAGSVSCADRGERGLEYRWSTQPAWATAPPSRPPGDEEFVVRMHVPLLGPRPAIRLYQPPSLVAADVDGRPLDLRDH
ncbi:MAG TPA: hypothetical protein VN603_09370, partial [Candidatus Acidoferrales bacterium]|nr:hypothetical protein [Candidatus Acidoferrales bacterium]